MTADRTYKSLGTDALDIASRTLQCSVGNLIARPGSDDAFCVTAFFEGNKKSHSLVLATWFWSMVLVHHPATRPVWEGGRGAPVRHLSLAVFS